MTVRTVLHGDLVAVARALLPLPAAERAAAVDQLIGAADLADRYRKRTGRPHPLHGSGSLMAAAASWDQPAEPWLDDPDYLACLGAVIGALRARRSWAARPTEGGRAAASLSSGPGR